MIDFSWLYIPLKKIKELINEIINCWKIIKSQKIEFLNHSPEDKTYCEESQGIRISLTYRFFQKKTVKRHTKSTLYKSIIDLN